MWNIKKNVQNGFFHYKYTHICQEILNNNEGVRKWCAIYDLSKRFSKDVIIYPHIQVFFQGISENRTKKYCAIIFEANKFLVADGLSITDAKTIVTFFSDDFNEVYEKTIEWGIEPEKFGPPWHDDYPF